MPSNNLRNNKVGLNTNFWGLNIDSSKKQGYLLKNKFQRNLEVKL
jgi:hypothetical protein